MHDMNARTTKLAEVNDDDFAWMLQGEPALRRGLTLPPGGVDTPEVLAIVRQIVARMHAEHCRGAWMMISGDEVVGLCSYRRPPANGEVEIGYGVAASRRGLGHATRAVEALCAEAMAAGVRVLCADTAIANPASGRVLAKNGFVSFGTRIDPDDGNVVIWRKALTSDAAAREDAEQQHSALPTLDRIGYPQ